MQFLQRIFTDARFGLRLLRRNPAFGVTMLTVLVVGIGATTAMFSLVASLLIRPLPYPHPEELTMVWGTQVHVPHSPLSLADFHDWREQGTTFNGMAAVGYIEYSLSSKGDKPENFSGATVTGDFFPLLGMAPLHGRFFGPEDDRVGGPRVAVLSARVWRGRFGADPSVVGRAVSLNGEPFTVIGIAPDGFRFSGPWSARCDVWTPLAVTHSDYAGFITDHRGSHSFHVIGRRKPGVSIEQAEAQLAGIAKTLETAHPGTNAHFGVLLDDLRHAIVRNSRQSVQILFFAVGLVFLAVCANVANLLLVRAAARRPEMAARVALGATRRRLLGQMITETVAVFVVAAVLGALLAHWLVGLFASGFVSAGAASTIDIRVDGVALAFAVGVAVLCGLVVGLVPAVEAQRVEPQAVIKESGARASLGRPARTLRAGLVVAQVALAFVLLAGSALSLRAFAKVAATPPGFDPTDLATTYISVASARAQDSDKLAAFWRDVIARTGAQPGVTSVAANSCVPFGPNSSNGGFDIEGRDPWPDGTGPLIEWNAVTTGYFHTMGIPVLRGRDILDSDVSGGRGIIVINQAAAERLFPGESAVGHRLNVGDGTGFREIVGVVGDVRRWSLSNAPSYEAYVPLTQGGPWSMTIIAKTAHPEALLKAMPGIVASVDPEQAIADARTMQSRLDDSLEGARFTARLLGAFAAVALALATLGIFGLVSYTTSQRTRELGIRIALGSSPERLVMLVMREGARLLLGGLVLGLVGAFFAGRQVAERVAGAAPFDAVAFAVIFGVLALAGLLASLLPALRAIRIPPAVALRYE